MIKIENVKVEGFEPAIRGMRNPKNSWDKSDSKQEDDKYELGENDAELCAKLAKGGSVHAKYRRMITVWCDITSNHTFWSEFDAYKVGTVRNSCSKMHKIHVKEFVADDFSHEGIDEVGTVTRTVFNSVIAELEYLRNMFNSIGDKKYWRAMIELLPMGFNLKATVMFNYEVLNHIYYSPRYNHKMFEWVELCNWIKTLPHADDMILVKYREPGWIDVAEKLPNNDRYVLIAFENFSNLMIGRCEGDEEQGYNWYIGDDDEPLIEHDLYVSHWMELPVAPK